MNEITESARALARRRLATLEPGYMQRTHETIIALRRPDGLYKVRDASDPHDQPELGLMFTEAVDRAEELILLRRSRVVQ